MRFLFLLVSSIVILLTPVYTYAADAINFDVTPIKYELDLDPGESVTLPATLFNRWTGTFDIITSTSDFEPSGLTGQPRFVRYSELVHADQQLSTWITLDTPGFTINGGESRVMNFTIDVPANATPGWHYGAVFLKKEGDILWSWIVGIHVDYGILILVNVSGDIVSTGSVSPISIWWGSTPKDVCPNWDNSGSLKDGKCDATGTPSEPVDNTPTWIDQCVIDFTASNFDGKCIDNPFFNPPSDTTDNQNDESNNTWSDLPNQNVENNENIENSDNTNNENWNGQEDNFNIVFDIPFKNDGNTHIKPDGSIVVKDERGKPIKQIWEKLIKNDKWAVIGKEIVDYLPINDEQWNVLPNSTRIFGYEWRWFPYRDINGEIVYRTPGEYYTLKNQKDAWFLMFWERVCTRKQFKTLTADIDLSYVNHEGKTIEFNSAEEFKIQYIEQYIWINPYVILPLILLLSLWFILWWYNFVFKTKKCVNKDCGKKIKKKAKVCPHCETIQNKKKTKKATTKTKKKK